MKKSVLLLLVAVIVLCSGCAVTVYEDNGDNSKTSKTQTVTVPNFLGLEFHQISEDSQYSDFNFVVKYEYHNEVAAGKIISQSFKPGRNIKKTEEIELVVSMGPEAVTIPEINGLNIEDAKMQLSRVGLKYNEIPQPSETVSKDCVIITNPAVGGVVPRGEVIDIYVSTGPDIKWVTVGEYTQLTESAARQLIEKDGFKAEIVYKDSTEPKGIVIAQSHPKGNHVEKGTAITLTVSTGLGGNN